MNEIYAVIESDLRQAAKRRANHPRFRPAKPAIMIAVGLLGLGGSAVAVAAVGGALGGSAHDQTRPEALASAQQYAAFARPQRADDVFHATSTNATNVAAGAQIAETSRLVATSAAGQVYAFLDAQNAMCVLWHPNAGGVAGVGCSRADSTRSPATLTLAADGSQATVAAVVKRGVDGVTVDSSSAGTTIPTSSGGFVYEAKPPFTIRWTDPDGTKNEIATPNTDVAGALLKPTG
jgi:hypothetical protein